MKALILLTVLMSAVALAGPDIPVHHKYPVFVADTHDEAPVYTRAAPLARARVERLQRLIPRAPQPSVVPELTPANTLQGRVGLDINVGRDLAITID